MQLNNKGQTQINKKKEKKKKIIYIKVVLTLNGSGTRLWTGISESSSFNPDSLARIMTCIINEYSQFVKRTNQQLHLFLTQFPVQVIGIRSLCSSFHTL